MPKPRVSRSPKWPAVEKAHLKANPSCAACATTKKVVVHHKMPVHVDSTRELDPANLITLCESPSHNCHLIYGHLLSWKSYSVSVVEDSALYLGKLQARPLVPFKP